MNDDDLWEEFVVQVFNSELKCKIPLCGLCGNSGIVDTLTTAKWCHQSVGIKTFCICPNGRYLKEDSK